MGINLQINHNVDGVPPGSQATQFGSAQMMDNVDHYLKNHPMGPDAARDEVMMSFVKGLGLENDPKALALTVPLKGFGPVLDDGLGQQNVSPAGIAAAFTAQTDLGIK